MTQKLRLDLVWNRGLYADMDTPTDDDTLELRRQLCTQIGIIMEDASVIALLVGHADAERLDEVARLLKSAESDCDALAAAVCVLGH